MSLANAHPVLNVHTPTSSFAIVHSITQESLLALYDKLSRKAHTDYHGERVGPGWLKYEFNDTIWNLDDDSDYTIFVWRQSQHASPSDPSSSASPSSGASLTPTLHLHNPSRPLPTPPEHCNPAYYVFDPARQAPRSTTTSPNRRSPSHKSRKTKAVSKHGKTVEDAGIPQFKKDFEKFHGENGVRTVIGSIGPIQNVRMLLKSGYRHVYISRKFALKHGFIPDDAAPGHYGYGGLVNIGSWPISLTPSPSFSAHPDAPPAPPALLQSTSTGKSKKKSQSGTGSKPALMQVYLSEEPHFDVVLGRSFFERRQIRVSAIDPTDVVCMDTGEKVECELVILKDGKGEIVTVT
ncbi:hypothetical protein HGRIS_012918 [Hohenbuehelia grisea]|uniref:Uncharacterized protein n=1 Tax=Hohenbuehelia grisea TaxID=104357 RepID=A0ABR3ITZ2_9AGAR